MVVVKDEAQMSCKTCNRIHTIPYLEAKFINNYFTEKRMGQESGYMFKHQIKCSCGSILDIEYEIYEYPEGKFDRDSVYVRGGKCIKKFEYLF